MMPAAFQDQIPDNLCYGCGPSNSRGLRLKSHWEDDVAVATFVPESHHAAGPPQFLNGGIIATIIDCHSVCTAIAGYYRSEGRRIDSQPPIWCATASLKIEYLRPTPIDKAVILRARIRESSEKKTLVLCSLYSEGRECVRGEVLAVRVSPSWRSRGSAD